MKKRDRFNLRLSTGDAALLRAAAQRLDVSISEMVRDAAVGAAIKAVRESVAGPAGRAEPARAAAASTASQLASA